MSLHAQCIQIEVESLGMKPSALEWKRMPWNAAECLGMQPSATKYKIVICAISYINIIFKGFKYYIRD
jgi:hypothetical protein